MPPFGTDGPILDPWLTTNMFYYRECGHVGHMTSWHMRLDMPSWIPFNRIGRHSEVTSRVQRIMPYMKRSLISHVSSVYWIRWMSVRRL